MEQVHSYTEKLTRRQNQYFKQYVDRLDADSVAQWMGEVLAKAEQAESKADWVEVILFWNETKSHLQTHFELVELAFQCNTKDEGLEKEQRRLQEEVEPVVDEWNAKIRERILACAELPALKQEFGEQYFIVLQLQQDAFDPKNIQLDTELNKVLADYTKLTGGANFEVEGKTYPIAHYKKFANSNDEKIRQASFLSFTSWYLKHRPALEEMYDKSIKLRDQMGKNLGYDGFIPLAYQKMRRTDYGPKEVAALRKQIETVIVPITQKIRERQAKDIGCESVEVWNGDYFPEWQLGEMKISVEAQPQSAQKIYDGLSPVLGGHFNQMREWGLIDLEARDGKGPGAFCTDFSDYRVPFIFLNSVNEASDLATMLHECGHSFQAWESRGIDLVELRWPTLEACEVHSMGMEFLAYPFYDEFFAGNDAQKYREKHLAESLLIMPYIAMVDEFQHMVYSGQAEGATGRAAAWENLEARYMPGVDFSSCPEWRRHRWIRQLHIFRVPFYYIDYAIAQIGAWQLWMQSLADKEATMTNYLNLCRLGGTLPLKDFFAAGKLELPFKPGVLQPLMDKILAVQPLV